MVNNLVGSLGKTITDSMSKSLSGFGAGLKGAAFSANPGGFGAIASLAKMFKSDQQTRQRDRAFDEEKSLEQRKLFTDILGEQKESNDILGNILKALTVKKEENNFLTILKNLIPVITGIIIAGYDKLLKMFRGFLKLIDTNFKGLFDNIKNVIKFVENSFIRLGKALTYIADLFNRFGNFLNDLLGKIKKLDFVDNLAKLFSNLPNRFKNLFDNVFGSLKNVFDDFKTKFRLPNFDDIIRAIEKTFGALPKSFGRLRNATLINVATLADMLDGIKANIGAKFDTFKGTFTNTFGKVGSYFDDLTIKFDSLKTSAFESFGRITSAFSDGRLALSLDDLGKIMPEILKGSGGFFDSISAKLGYFYQTYIVETLQKGLKAMGDSIDAIKNSKAVAELLRIGKKLLKFLIPLDIILSIFDGLSLAFDEKAVASILDKNSIQVTFMDRVSAFLGGGISSFFLGFVDIASQVLNYAISNLFGSGATWAESYNTGLEEVGDIYLTKIFSNIFGFVKETVKLIGALFTFDGEGIKNAFTELYLIFDDFVVNLVNFGREILDKLGIRGFFIKIGNVIGNFFNDVSNFVGEGMFNAGKFVLKYISKAVDGVVNAVGPTIISMFNAIVSGINLVVGGIIEGVAKAVSVFNESAANKVRDFGKSLTFKEATFTPYKSTASELAERREKVGYQKSIFIPTDEKYVRDRDAVVSTKSKRDKAAVNEVKPAPATTEKAAPKTDTPTSSSAGGSKPPPLSVRNNNPGNLRYDSRYTGPGSVLEGAVPGERGFARFDTPELGMRAMERQIALDTQKRGKTLAEFISKYAPANENDTVLYIKQVAASLGINPNERIPPDKLDELQKAMIRKEGGAAAAKHYAGVNPQTSSGSLLNVQLPSIAMMPGGMTSMSNTANVSPVKFSNFLKSEHAAGGPLFTGNFNSSGNKEPDRNYLLGLAEEDEAVRYNVRENLDSKKPSTTAKTGITPEQQLVVQTENVYEANLEILNANKTAVDNSGKLVVSARENNEMANQNLGYQKEIAGGVKKLNEYEQQRKNLELQFLNQIQSDVNKGIYKALGPAGIGSTESKNSFNAINQFYTNAFQNFSTKILGKEMGPVYGAIFSQLASSYTSEFINQTLGPIFGPNASQGINRAINNYAQGASVRKQYDVMRSDYNKMESDFKQLSSQVTIVDRLNSIKSLTGKPSKQKLDLISQIDTMEKALAQKGIQLGQVKEAKDRNKSMVFEDLIFGMTGISTGTRSMMGYEQGINNFSKQMALIIGAPISGAFGSGEGYAEYRKNFEKQLAQQNDVNAANAKLQLGVGDAHALGVDRVHTAHLEGSAKLLDIEFQGRQELLKQEHQMRMQTMGGGIGGGGGGSFFDTLLDKGLNFLGNKFLGNGESSSFNPMNFPAKDDDGNFMPGYAMNNETGESYYRGFGLDSESATSSSGFFSNLSTDISDMFSSVTNFFKPSAPTGAGGSISGVTGPAKVSSGGGMPSFGDMLTNMAGSYFGNAIGSKLGVKQGSFGGMLTQGLINSSASKLIGNVVSGKDVLSGFSGISAGLQTTIQGMFNPQSLGNSIAKGFTYLANTKTLGGTVFGSALGEFGAGMANPSTALNAGTSTVGAVGGIAGAGMAGYSTYQMSKALSGGYEVKGLNAIAGIASFAATLGAFGAGAGLAAIGGGAFGATAAFLGMNPIGLAILGIAVLGNRFFGMKAPKTTSQGVTGTLAEGSATSLTNYKDVFQKGGKSRSDKRYTEYSAADPELIKYMQAGVNSVFSSVRAGAKIIGVNAEAITGFTQEIKLNMLGMSQDDQAKSIITSIKDFSDAMLLSAYPALAAFTLEGEKLHETFGRLVTSVQFMDTAFDMLRYNSDDLAKTIGGKTGFELANLKYELIGMFGGEDLEEQQVNFNKAVGDYYKNFYTQEEQLDFNIRQREKLFEQIETQIKEKINIPGLEDFNIPGFKSTVEESRIAYREFIDNFVATTGLASEESQNIYAQLIAAAPDFFAGAQEFVALNKTKNKTKTAEELAGAGKLYTGTYSQDERELGKGIFAGGFESSFNAGGNLNYTESDFTSAGITSTATASGTNFLAAQGDAIIKSFETGTNVNTVVDNSVRQTSSPITTFVMNDDKVRDFHPILRNTERSSLRAFTLAMR